MTALSDFLKAAASYWGVPVDQVTADSTLDTSNGDIEVVLRVAVSSSDVAEIAQRMERMKLEQRVDEQQAGAVAQAQAVMQAAYDEQWRLRYNALSPAEKSRYGSFARFKADIPLDLSLPLPEPAVLPGHVYVPGHQITEQQKAMAVGMDEKGRYAMDPADLSPEQRERICGGSL